GEAVVQAAVELNAVIAAADRGGAARLLERDDQTIARRQHDDGAGRVVEPERRLIVVRGLEQDLVSGQQADGAGAALDRAGRVPRERAVARRVLAGRADLAEVDRQLRAGVREGRARSVDVQW